MSSITKAYIIRINHQLSEERASQSALSCDNVGLPYEYYQGSQGISEEELWNNPPLVLNCKHKFTIPVMNATRSHMLLWKKIYESKETAAILEHDSYVYYKPNVDIPDGTIVVLGYKIMNKDDYNYIAAGPPRELVKIMHHIGAHAYAITWKTAEMLLEELYKYGVRSCIDTGYFMKWKDNKTWGYKDPPPEKESGIPLMIMNPIAAVAWVRDERSTVSWNTGAANHDPLPSFKNNVS